MDRMGRAEPRRSWPTKLRHALRAHLAARGRTIPEGLRIRHRQGRDGAPDSIEIRDDPIATETMTRFTYVATPIGEDGRATSEFLEAALGHADRMRRARARLDALTAAGHPPRDPPRHAVETHPVIALALRLADEGRAGVSGETGVADGVMWAKDLRMTCDGVPVAIRTATTARLTFEGEWPETLAGLAGLPLASLVQLPELGREAVDAPMRSLVISRSWVEGGRLTLELEPTTAVSIDDTPVGEDGRWKALGPVPMV